MDGSDPTSSAAPTDSVRFGHFRVARRPDGSLDELGRGAMGVTYRAMDDGLRIPVALKVIADDYVHDEQARRRFQREARAAAQLRHPNIASVVHLGEEGGEFFYAMEFVVGRPLSSILRETPVLTPKLALALCAQVAAALAAAHKRELIHRDLKPANLMVLEGDAIDHEDERSVAAGDRQVKVIDFGLARSFGQTRIEDSLASITAVASAFTGTPAYASPEQCAGAADLDGRSDLYSLGVILWQLLTGKLPFTGTLSQVIGKHQFQAPPFEQLAGQPPEIITLLRGLMEKEPDQRMPARAGELRDELDRLRREIGDRPIPAAPPPLPKSALPPGPTASEAGTTLVLPARPPTFTSTSVHPETEHTLVLPATAVPAPAAPPPLAPLESSPAATPLAPSPASGSAGAPMDWNHEIERLVRFLFSVPRKIWIIAFVLWIVFWATNRPERSRKKETDSKRATSLLSPSKPEIPAPPKPPPAREPEAESDSLGRDR